MLLILPWIQSLHQTRGDSVGTDPLLMAQVHGVDAAAAFGCGTVLRHHEPAREILGKGESTGVIEAVGRARPVRAACRRVRHSHHPLDRFCVRVYSNVIERAITVM